MNEGNAELLAMVNGNPAKTLDKVIAERNIDVKINELGVLGTLIDQKKDSLAAVRLWANDEIYYEFNNPQYYNGRNDPEATSLPYTVNINADGSINITATIRSTDKDSPSIYLAIILNGVRKVSLYTDSESYVTLVGKVAVKAGDVMTFELSTGGDAASAYLQENSLMILGKAVKLSEIGLLEVIASD